MPALPRLRDGCFSGPAVQSGAAWEIAHPGVPVALNGVEVGKAALNALGARRGGRPPY